VGSPDNTLCMRIRVVLVGASLIATAACGGGGPSKEAFAEKANPPCGTANTELAGVTKPADFRQLGDVAGKVAGSTDKQVKALTDLEQPDDDKPQLERMLTSMRATSSSARAVEAGVQRGDLRAAEKGVSDLKLASEQADDTARSYGLTDCGKGARAASALMTEASNDVLKREVIAKADGFCKDANRRLDELTEPEDLEELVKFLDQSLAVADKLVADLRGIAVPDSLKAAYDDVMASNDRLVALIRDARAAAQAGNERRAGQLFDQLDTATTEANKKADAFGFKDCGSDA
jgi:hypothetical protein